MRARNIISIFATASMLLIMLDPTTAYFGTTQGLKQCIEVIIPSLFPFFFLSTLLCGTLLGCKIRLLQPLTHFLRIPDGTESVFLLGILGGYPVGAQTIATAWSEGALHKDDAHRMLGFCNNAGPSFIFGIAASIFDSSAIAWLLWIIHIASAVVVARILPYRKRGTPIVIQKITISLPDVLKKSIMITATVCGWVTLFRFLIAYIDKWIFPLLQPTAKICIIGVLELANGCISLNEIYIPALKFVLCSTFLAFGGVCVHLQTHHVVGTLGTGLYFRGKCYQTLISLILSAITVYFLFPQQVNAYLLFSFIILAVVFGALLYFLQKTRNRYGNQADCDV